MVDADPLPVELSDQGLWAVREDLSGLRGPRLLYRPKLVDALVVLVVGLLAAHLDEQFVDDLPPAVDEADVFKVVVDIQAVNDALGVVIVHLVVKVLVLQRPRVRVGKGDSNDHQLCVWFWELKQGRNDAKDHDRHCLAVTAVFGARVEGNAKALQVGLQLVEREVKSSSRRLCQDAQIDALVDQKSQRVVVAVLVAELFRSALL